MINALSVFKRILPLAFAFAALAIQPLSAESSRPVIEKVTFAYLSGNPIPTELTIFGSGFGVHQPTVLLDGIAQTVTSFSQNQVNVSLLSGSLVAGSYLLTLIPAEKSDDTPVAKFHITLGTVGPQGDPGIQGPSGVQGPAGPAGPAGPSGAGFAGYQIISQAVTVGVDLSNFQAFYTSCPAGQVAISGSYSRTSTSLVGETVYAYPSFVPTSGSWTTAIYNADLFQKTYNLYVVCVNAH